MRLKGWGYVVRRREEEIKLETSLGEVVTRSPPSNMMYGTFYP
jgi:hypothetical protein